MNPWPLLREAYRLADTEDLGYDASVMVVRCKAAGLDPRVYRGIIGAASSLLWWDLPPYPAYASDKDLVDAITDLENLIVSLLAQIERLDQRIAAAHARNNMADEAFLQRRAVLNAAQDVINVAYKRICYALNRLMAAPTDLGSTYAAAYRLIRSGGALPYQSSWLTGALPDHT